MVNTINGEWWWTSHLVRLYAVQKTKTILYPKLNPGVIGDRVPIKTWVTLAIFILIRLNWSSKCEIKFLL